MAEITASVVKELREKTGAGMMDCKKALAETKGDMEEAVQWLRKKGLAAAAKRASRLAKEREKHFDGEMLDDVRSQNRSGVADYLIGCVI